MTEEEARERLAAARVGRLATADAAGVPHVVPFVFAVDGGTVYWAVDRKPKRSPRLKRIENIRANPNVDMVVDHYEEDWNGIWWVRARGSARILEERAERENAIRLLSEKYSQYDPTALDRDVVAIDVSRITWWEPAAS